MTRVSCLGCSCRSRWHDLAVHLYSCTAPKPDRPPCIFCHAALPHRIQPCFLHRPPALLTQTLYNFGLTAKPFCSYRMSDALAGSLGIEPEVAEVRFAPSASGVRCCHTPADDAMLWPGCLHSCPPPVWTPVMLEAYLGIVYMQANVMCDYPAGRRFQPLTLALDNLTDCGTGTCAMHRCTSRQLACGLGLQLYPGAVLWLTD